MKNSQKPRNNPAGLNKSAAILQNLYWGIKIVAELITDFLKFK